MQLLRHIVPGAWTEPEDGVYQLALSGMTLSVVLLDTLDWAVELSCESMPLFKMADCDSSHCFRQYFAFVDSLKGL